VRTPAVNNRFSFSFCHSKNAVKRVEQKKSRSGTRILFADFVPKPAIRSHVNLKENGFNFFQSFVYYTLYYAIYIILLYYVLSSYDHKTYYVYMYVHHLGLSFPPSPLRTDRGIYSLFFFRDFSTRALYTYIKRIVHRIYYYNWICTFAAALLSCLLVRG